MSNHADKKVYAPRHWLFYAIVFSVVGAVLGVAASILDLSNGLTFATGAVACTITCIIALREDLFGPVSAQQEQRNRRA